jgi:hypothetical protein
MPRGSCGVGGCGCLAGGRYWSPRAADRISTGSPRLIRPRPSILGGSELGPPISAPIKICGVLIVIIGFGDAGCRGGAAAFSSALPSFGLSPS